MQDAAIRAGLDGVDLVEERETTVAGRPAVRHTYAWTLDGRTIRQRVWCLLEGATGTRSRPRPRSRSSTSCGPCLRAPSRRSPSLSDGSRRAPPSPMTAPTSSGGRGSRGCGRWRECWGMSSGADLTVAGRTDRGVHALANVVSFHGGADSHRRRAEREAARRRRGAGRRARARRLRCPRVGALAHVRLPDPDEGRDRRVPPPLRAAPAAGRRHGSAVGLRRGGGRPPRLHRVHASPRRSMCSSSAR